MTSRPMLPGKALVFLTCLSSLCGYSQDSADVLAANQSRHEARAFLPNKLLDRLHAVNGRGITFQGQVVHDWSAGAGDRDDAPGGFGRYSLDFSAALDGDKLLAWKGSSGFIRLKQHVNEFGETSDGAAQLYSNIDAPSRTILYEIYFEQKLASDRVRFKVGKIDANTEFAVVQNAGDFLNSSMGFSPTIIEFPSYPEPKVAFSTFLRPAKGYAFNLGVFRTAGEGTLSIIEPGRTWALSNSDLPGRVSFGYWRRDGDRERFDGGVAAVSQGYYSVLEQAWWRQTVAGEKGERTLATFFQFGHADGQVTAFTHHVGGGAILQAPLAVRPHDSIGAAATWVHFSSDPDADFDWSSELILETYYKISIAKHLTLVQDFQLLHHPGGLRTNPDCLMVTPRLVFAF